MTNNDSNINEVTRKILAVKQAHEKAIMAKANVVGVGVGFRQVKGRLTDTPALVVMVTQKKPPADLAPEDFIPSSIDDVPVDVQEVGEITIHS